MSTETLSQQLIYEMERLHASVTASFADTDALMAQWGVNRETLAPLIARGKSRLSEAERGELARREHALRNRSEHALDHQPTAPRLQLARIQLGLINRI
ncbi:hypothetical protein HCH_03282 [Hahella chejuensis KCTC 2396]|uniref:Uncharacterized protein n=1 Tax=Hahella chejuensis (strain KCTC 2396) TaxID=349521 RepID=Q2SH36_HAHCH|nr:hypothetical protein [Hahella chejuensis]ABC30038.1 hypothetical protein HCH_03282 [Hahella chejuensis KCTC 2396]